MGALKYIAVGTGVVVVGYVVARLMQPQKPTVAGALGDLFVAVKNLATPGTAPAAPSSPFGDAWDELTAPFKGASASAGVSSPPGIAAQWTSDETPPYTSLAASDGDAAIADAQGFDRGNRMNQTADEYWRYADRAVAGDTNYSPYATAPAR